MTIQVLEISFTLYKDENVHRLTDKQLVNLHYETHLAWGIKQKTDEYHSPRGVSWSKEDIWNLHKLITEEMIRRGFKPKMVSSLDKPLAEAGIKALASFAVQLSKYGQPTHSGNITGMEITLDEVLKYIQPIKLSHPFVYVTGGVVNHGRTEGDIDILIKASSNDEIVQPLMFRIIRLFPVEMQDRIHFVFAEAPDQMRSLSGPFTSNIPVYTLECATIEPFERMEMSEGLSPLDLSTISEDQRLKLFLVGAHESLWEVTDGLMLNAYNLSDLQIEKAKTFKGRIILDNGAFQDRTLTTEELLSKVSKLKPHVVCAPDFPFNIDSHTISLSAQKEFWERSPDDIDIMFIPQAQSVDKFLWCLDEMIKFKPDVIGLGRLTAKITGWPGSGMRQRIFMLDYLNKHGYLTRIRKAGIRLHALGLSSPLEFKYFNFWGFDSVDSMGYIYSSMYRQMVLPDEPDERWFTFDVQGNVKPKKFDTPEILNRKTQLAKEFLSLPTLTDKQKFIISKIWRPCACQTTSQKHIDAILQGLDISQRDDSPKTSKQELSTEVKQ